MDGLESIHTHTHGRGRPPPSPYTKCKVPRRISIAIIIIIGKNPIFWVMMRSQAIRIIHRSQSFLFLTQGNQKILRGIYFYFRVLSLSTQCMKISRKVSLEQYCKYFAFQTFPSNSQLQSKHKEKLER